MSSQKQIPVVDLRYMTQGDLQALADSSPTLFDFEPLTAIIPTLDPSTLNESASSRKQTFAHVPLNINSDNAELIPKSNTRRYSRHKNPNSILGIRPREDDVPSKETHQIASALKKLFASREKNEVFEKLDQEVMNLKGEVVDLEELEKKENLYEDVIGKRTEGLEKEDQLLGYMGLLDGKWGSSRKKSKIVDAGLFGCELPKGWKVVLALKRKDKRVFLHCREFVSPSGKHFANCKEVSSYILSLNVHHDSSQQISDQHSLSASNTDKALGNVTNQTQEVNEVELGNCSSVTPISYISTECEKQWQLFNITDGPEKEKHLQCQKYNLTFIDEDAQSQHSCTSRRNVKMRRLGQSFTEGVIIKDGKYECQFCPKNFTEKEGFNRHVGVHKRHERLKCNESVTEGVRNVMTESLVPCNQSNNDFSVSEKVEASVHNNSAIHIIESVSKGRECNLNESGAQGEMNISNSFSTSLMPYDQSKNKISVNENAKTSLHNSSAKHLTEANEGKHDLNESVTEVVKNITNFSSASLMPYDQSINKISIDENSTVHNDFEKHITKAISKEVEHNLKGSIHSDDVSPGEFFDNSIKDDIHNSDDTKEIICNDGTMDMPFYACTNITSHSENHVTNEFNVRSPAINEVPFTKQSIHDPIVECEEAQTKSGISEELNAESEKSKVYLISPSPSACENKSDSVACGNIVNSKTEETHVVATGVKLVEIPEEIIEIPECNFEGGQISNCDMTTDDSSDAVVTSNTMSIEANTKIMKPNAISGDETKYSTSKENEMVESDDYMDGKGIFDSTMRNKLNLSNDFSDIANEPTSGTETNAGCMFPDDRNKSLFDGTFNIEDEFQSYFQNRNVGNENASSDITDNNDGRQASQDAEQPKERAVALIWIGRSEPWKHGPFRNFSIYWSVVNASTNGVISRSSA